MRALIAIVTLLAATLATAPVAAHPDHTTRDEHGRPRVLAHHEGDVIVPGGEIFLLTDSVVLGAVEELGQLVTDRPYTAVGYPGFHVWAAPGVIAAQRPRTHDTVIIALGNNDWGAVGRATIDGWIDDVMASLSHTTQVIWVRQRRWHASMYTWNDALTAATDRHRSLELADWPARSQAHPEYFYNDGIHLRPAGQWAMARLLDDHVRGRVQIPGRGVRGALAVRSAPAGINASGWALDIERRRPIEIRLLLDGRSVAELVAERPRPDVAEAWGQGPDHGFVHRIERVRDGTRSVCLDARDETDRWVRIECETVPVAHSPIGDLASIERVGDRLRVRGWAFDPDATDKPVRIRVTADRSSVGGPLADRPRADVAAKYGIDPHHGFRFTIALPPGTREACVWALDRPRSRNTKLGCVVSQP